MTSEKPTTSDKYINIYDFDHTIYDGDCSLDFYYFCVRAQPSLLRYFPYQLYHFILFKLGAESRDQFKANFFIFLRSVKNLDRSLKTFWDKHYTKIKKWYLETSSNKDIVISASPEFLLKPATDRLGIKLLIATDMNPRTGKITGKNCRAEEKVLRLKKELGEVNVANAYSDTLIDLPILTLAKEGYIVKKHQLIKLKEYKS